MNFSGKFGSDQTIWYPASGYRSYSDGSLTPVGNYSFWSASPSSNDAYYLSFYYYGLVFPSLSGPRASGQSVRCLQE
jgi:hypothetical protein